MLWGDDGSFDTKKYIFKDTYCMQMKTVFKLTKTKSLLLEQFWFLFQMLNKFTGCSRGLFTNEGAKSSLWEQFWFLLNKFTNVHDIIDVTFYKLFTK